MTEDGDKTKPTDITQARKKRGLPKTSSQESTTPGASDINPLKFPSRERRKKQSERIKSFTGYFQNLITAHFSDYEKTPADMIQTLIDSGITPDADPDSPLIQFEDKNLQRALAKLMRSPFGDISILPQAHAGIELDKRIFILKGSIEHDERRIILNTTTNKKGTPILVTSMSFR